MPPRSAPSPDFPSLRREMLRRHLMPRGIRDERVLAAMGEVPREAFVPEDLRHAAYEDRALPIGQGQTISQPYIVAVMAQALELGPGARVLEVGVGSGYAAAVLSRVAEHVFGVEVHAPLVEEARRRLAGLGYVNVTLKHDDGSVGWGEHAPFDGISVAASGPEVPRTLMEQLAVGGRLVVPVGATRRTQELVVVERRGEGEFHERSLGGVQFVPLVGEEGWGAGEGRAGEAEG